MWNCSAIFIANRKPAIAPPSTLPARSSFHYLATNGVSYASARERELCDVFTAIRHHRTLATAGRLLARNSERYLKSPQEMQALFADLPEAIANTVELSSRLDIHLQRSGI